MEIKGNKTYIVGVAMLCYALGGAVSGKVDINAAVQVALEALGIMGIRHGIGN